MAGSRVSGMGGVGSRLSGTGSRVGGVGSRLSRTAAAIVATGWLVAAGCAADNASHEVRVSGGALGIRAPRAGLVTPAMLTLAGPTWRWVETRMGDGSVIAAPGSKDLYTVAFAGQAAGTASVSADCNTGSGPYASDGVSLLVIGPLEVTDAACTEGSEGASFVQQLQATTSFVIAAGRLEIAVAGVSVEAASGAGAGAAGYRGSGIMVLEAAVP